MNRICKWYICCPIKYFVDSGMLERKWVENYCLIGNKDCVRYQKEENGEIHPDKMLPNGEIKKGLK
ncbi:MAG: uracil-DNA glycosylase [Promethearchaeota archaeon]